MEQVIQVSNSDVGGKRVPVVRFSKGGGLWIEEMAGAGCDAIGVDWTIELGDARKLVGGSVAIQGNLDPAVLYSSPETIRQHVSRLLESYGSGNGHVFNLGHGIQPKIDPENVAVLVESVHELSKPYHA